MNIKKLSVYKILLIIFLFSFIVNNVQSQKNNDLEYYIDDYKFEINIEIMNLKVDLLFSCKFNRTKEFSGLLFVSKPELNSDMELSDNEKDEIDRYFANFQNLQLMMPLNMDNFNSNKFLLSNYLVNEAFQNVEYIKNESIKSIISNLTMLIIQFTAINILIPDLIVLNTQEHLIQTEINGVKIETIIDYNKYIKSRRIMLNIDVNSTVVSLLELNTITD